jgi:septum formation protein
MARTDLRLILASQSPRRAELLRRLGLDFEVFPADVDEVHSAGEPPEVYAERLAREKAIAILRKQPDATVLGSDTVVVLDGDVLGKPRDDGEAVRMLMRLSGRSHEVFTGVAVASSSGTASAVERVEVRFREITAVECEAYAATGEPRDKAGAYGIQGYGSVLVEGIQGDFFAVMGLPIARTVALLRELGWEYRFDAGLQRPDPISP